MMDNGGFKFWIASLGGAGTQAYLPPIRSLQHCCGPAMYKETD